MNVGDRALACAVVLKAIEDFMAPDGTVDITEQDRADAKAFLTSRHPGWTQSRIDWCILADLDPQVVREQALAGFPRLRRRRVAAMAGGVFTGNWNDPYDDAD